MRRNTLRHVRSPFVVQAGADLVIEMYCATDSGTPIGVASVGTDRGAAEPAAARHPVSRPMRLRRALVLDAHGRGRGVASAPIPSAAVLLGEPHYVQVILIAGIGSARLTNVIEERIR